MIYGIEPESSTVIESEDCPLLVRFAEVNETLALLTAKTAGLAASLVISEVSKFTVNFLSTSDEVIVSLAFTPPMLTMSLPSVPETIYASPTLEAVDAVTVTSAVLTVTAALPPAATEESMS